jgi:hypothetical protein
LPCTTDEPENSVASASASCDISVSETVVTPHFYGNFSWANKDEIWKCIQ